MSSATLQDLYSNLSHKQIAEKAEDMFRGDQIKRRKLSERIAHYMPHAILIVWITSYALSAPHTAELFVRITPQTTPFGFNVTKWIVNIAPVAIEGFVFVLSAMRQYGRKGLSTLLFSLLTLSILVNVVGGVVILNDAGVTTSAILTGAITLDHAWILVSVFAGVLISLVSYVAGKLIVEFSTGDINMEIDSSKAWFGRTKYYALREAFYNAGLKYGATPTRATKYAETMALEYCEGEVSVSNDGTVQAVTRPQMLQSSTSRLAPVMSRTELGQSESVPQSLNEMGFAKMAHLQSAQTLQRHGTDSSPTVDSVDSPLVSRMTTKTMCDWLTNNPDEWTQYAKGSTKREKSKAIAYAVGGNESGYKTVERAFARMNIEL